MGAVSEAAKVLGAGLSNDNASTESITIAARFWQCALRSNPNANTLAGFGWYADITILDDATWSDLTRRTLSLTHGAIDRARDVAGRADHVTPSPDTLEILNQLIRGGGEVWEQYFILTAASEAVAQAPHSVTESEEYERLRTALLERGIEIPPDQLEPPDDEPDRLGEPEQ
jgi:hypothetical protein